MPKDLKTDEYAYGKNALKESLYSAKEVAQVLLAIKEWEELTEKESLKVFLKTRFPVITDDVLMRVGDHLFTM